MIVKPVGEPTHADPDAFEHAVASELVHDERWLHPAGLLVRVGHDAPDEVKMLMLMLMLLHLMKCDDDDIYIMMSVCLCVTKNHHFLKRSVCRP